MKKGIIGIIILGCSMSAASAFDISGCQEKQFTVTAYYSPMSRQSFYYKPTYQDEVTLNGEGVAGASGKEVFQGMLAGPATYTFGSVIYFPGLGAGEIADRGGAIVLSGEKGQMSDRIDIRMGKGEEGLVRALTFGKKTMTGYVCGHTDRKQVRKDAIIRDNVPTYKHFFDIALWIQQLEEGRDDIRTWTLQKYLVKLGYLNKRERNGEYSRQTKKSLCSYQVARGILSARNPDCGVFGKLTRYIMKSEAKKNGLLPDDLYATGIFAAIIDQAKYYNGKPSEIAALQQGNISTLQQPTQPHRFEFYRAYSKGQKSSEIKILQGFLQSQGLYTGTIDGIYSKMTMDVVYIFQKKNNLISDKDPLTVRGFLGPKTRSKINELRLKDK